MMTEETNQNSPGEDEKEKIETLYDVLGVARDAPLEAIKRHWRKWARENHPDLNKNADVEEFKKRSAAAEILTDKERRARYDETGRDRASPDEVRAAVLAICQQIVQSIVGSPIDDDLARVNVTVRVLELLATKDHEFVSARAEIRRRLRRAHVVINRIKPKGRKARENDVVSAILRTSIAALESELASLDKKERIHFAVTEIWTQYGYDMDYSTDDLADDIEEANERMLTSLRHLGPPHKRLGRPPARPPAPDDDPA